MTALPDVFASKTEASVAQKQTKLIDELYKQIGQLKVENDWLKKNLRSSMTHRREAIDRGHSQLSINRQRDLLGPSKNALYYRPILESPYNLELMDLIDKK